MYRYVRLAIRFGFALSLGLSAIGAAGGDDPWIGREFMPKSMCQPKIGTRNVPLDRLFCPFRVQKVSRDWLWVGKAWVKKEHVFAVSTPIEEFDVARHGDLLLLPVKIAGNEYGFLVDTGFTLSAIDITLAPLLIPTGRTKRLNGATVVDVYELPQAFVGNSKFPVTGDVLVLDLEPFRKASGQEFYGILGMAFLHQKIVRIDFDAGKVAILRAPPAGIDDSFHLSYNNYKAPVVRLEVAPDKNVSFFLDTGAARRDCGRIQHSVFDELNKVGQLALADETAETLTVGGIKTSRRGQLNRCRLRKFEHSKLIFMEGDVSLLSLGYLSRFCVTLDFHGDRIYLQKGRRFDEGPPDQSE